MESSFRIEPKQPVPKVGLIGDASDLSDAIQSSFPMDTDNAVLHWNRVPIPICYKYDLSIIIESVLEVLECCLVVKTEEICFPSNTFHSVWTIKPNNTMVRISACWHSVTGGIESDLNKNSELVISKIYFLLQWSRLIEVALSGVRQANLYIQDPQQLYEAEALLERIYALQSSNG